jgi:hypothetical protein
MLAQWWEGLLNFSSSPLQRATQIFRVRMKDAEYPNLRHRGT